MPRSYLDYNATAPIHPEVIEEVSRVMAEVGNASSVHTSGRVARRSVEEARDKVARLAHVLRSQVFFNSGATEGNNTVLLAHISERKGDLIVSAIEHPSILVSATTFGTARIVHVSRDGMIELDSLETLLKNSTSALVCLQYVNNETGVIQPVADAASLCHQYGATLLCDAVQAAGRMEVDFANLGADYMTLSSHKIGGPQGVGALICREGITPPRLLQGGGQEQNQRGGTYNVAGIAGFGVAADLASTNQNHYVSTTSALQKRLEEGLLCLNPSLFVAGKNAQRVSNTSCISLLNTSAQTQVMFLDLEGVDVSAGSACSSGTIKPSPVLEAMGYTDGIAGASLRFSTGWNSTQEDIDHALTACEKMLGQINSKGRPTK